MFSFGGFSSMIPYIGYLMVMWVCILIGISGHANKLLGIILNPSLSVETTTKENIQAYEVFYQKVNSVKKKFSDKTFAGFLFYKYKDTQIKPPRFKDIGLKIPSDPYLSLNHLRAPPIA